MLTNLASSVLARYERFNSERQLAVLRKTIGTGLRRGAETRLMRLRDAVGFEGKRVLEIGGDLEGNLARACVALGAEHVTSINHDRDFEPREDARVTLLKMDAREIDFPGMKFDLVLGFAVLEHVREIEEMLERVYTVTKPGGHVSLHGGPLWHCHIGHHLIVRGSSGQDWRFDRSGNAINPLEDWAHLLREPAELRDRLVHRGVPGPDSAEIVEYVFSTDLVNRYSVAHIKQCFYDSRFSVLQCREGVDKRRRADITALLATKYGLPESEFQTNSIEFLLRK